MINYRFKSNAESAYVIFDVGFAAGQQDDPARLIVTILAAEVEGRKAPPVLDVEVAPGAHQDPHRLAVPLPGCLVQGRVPVLKYKTKAIFLGGVRKRRH